MKHLLERHHVKHMHQVGIENSHDLFIVDVNDQQYQAAARLWKKTLPLASEKEIHTRVIAHLLWAKQNNLRPQTVKRYRWNWLLWALIVGLLLLLYLIWPHRAHAQFSKINTVTVTDGTHTGFLASPYTLSFAGCVVSPSGTTITISCTGAAGNPGGSANQVQYNSAGTAFGGISSCGHVGCVLIDQGAGNLPAFADPLVQGTQAAGSLTEPNPVLDGVWDGTNLRAMLGDSSGRPTVNVNGTVPVSGTFWQATQPVSGTFWQATQPVSGTFWQATQPVSSTQLPVALDGSGFLKVHEQGTAAVSGTVTANAGTGTFNIQQSNVTADYDTGAGTQNLTMFGLALPASGGAVAGGTATNPIQVSLANTAANSTAVKVDGSAVTQPVSGTVTANQGGTWNIGTLASITNPVAVTGTFWQATQPVSGTVAATQSGTWTVQPGNTANTTAWKVDGSAVTQPVSGTVSAAESGTWTTRIVGNAGVALDAATGAAPPANALLNAGLGSGATGGTLVGMSIADTYKPISVSTATTTLLVTGVSGRQVRVSSINLIAAGADNVALIEGTGATCGTGSAGLTGGTTAASGWNFAANGGLAFGTGTGTIIQTATTGDSVCVVTSASVQLSGGMMYAIY